MNARERNLLIVLGLTLFGVLNFVGYNALTTWKARVAKEAEQHRQTLEIARFAREQADAVQGEIDWLEKNKPEPKEAELVPSELQTFVTGRANSTGLTVAKQDILDNMTEGTYFERARFRINVTGREDALYRWLVELQSPKDFRAVTALRLSPNREDDTKIDAVVQVEQWFQPKASEEL